MYKKYVDTKLKKLIVGTKTLLPAKLANECVEQIELLQSRLNVLINGGEFVPADVNKDGKVDEVDLSVVHKGYSKAVKKKVTKKINKKAAIKK